MRRFTLLPMLVLALAACGDDETSPSGDGDTGAGGDAGTTDTVSDGSGMSDVGGEDAGGEDTAEADATEDVEDPGCPAPGPLDDTIDTTPDDACAADWVVFVEGTITDEAGAPIECAFTQMCVRGGGRGELLCLNPVRSGPDGTYRVTIPTSARCVAEGSMRILVPGEDRATTYCHVEPSGDALTDAGEMRLYATERVTDLPAFGDATEAREVTFGGGLVVDVQPDLIGFGTEAQDRYEALASVQLDPADPSLCFLGDTQPTALWAFSPEANVSEANSFSVRMPNEGDLAPGTVVDLYALGGLGTTGPDGREIAETEWAVVGTATVSEDGSEIVGDAADGGLPVFSFFGYAPQAAE